MPILESIRSMRGFFTSSSAHFFMICICRTFRLAIICFGDLMAWSQIANILNGKANQQSTKKKKIKYYGEFRSIFNRYNPWRVCCCRRFFFNSRIIVSYKLNVIKTRPFTTLAIILIARFVVVTRFRYPHVYVHLALPHHFQFLDVNMLSHHKISLPITSHLLRLYAHLGRAH